MSAAASKHDKRKTGRSSRRWLLIAVCAAVLVTLAALAGGALAMNIVSPNQFAWSENSGWLNANPTTSPGNGLNVTSSGITGSMWGENLGWVSFSCSNRGTCANNNYAVTNDGFGHLAGYAWAENGGWISMSCTNRGTCAANNYRVTIDSSGQFHGYAWGENVGWISFNCLNNGTCTNNSYNVQTSWLAPTPMSVGGIAEQPDVSALPAGTSSSGDSRLPYVVGALLGALLVGIVGWKLLRSAGGRES